MHVLIVVDMQNDFIDGALGTAEAIAIVPNVIKKIRDFDGIVLATKDTHGEDYLSTQEGKNLPVVHCVKGTEGWELNPSVAELIDEPAIEKPTFGSVRLGEVLAALSRKAPVEDITLIGLCTDICVISNAMIAKAYLPEVPVIVDASCCAGVTPASHNNALEAMKVCQIQVVNQE